MTKTEMIERIAEVSVELMDINELVAYATEMMIKDLESQSDDEIQDQYDYIAD